MTPRFGIWYSIQLSYGRMTLFSWALPPFELLPELWLGSDLALVPQGTIPRLCRRASLGPQALGWRAAFQLLVVAQFGFIPLASDAVDTFGALPRTGDRSRITRAARRS